jgi:hypothetical protein
VPYSNLLARVTGELIQRGESMRKSKKYQRKRVKQEQETQNEPQD